MAVRQHVRRAPTEARLVYLAEDALPIVRQRMAGMARQAPEPKAVALVYAKFDRRKRSL